MKKQLRAILVISLFVPLMNRTWAEPISVHILSAVVKDRSISDAAVIIQKNGAQSVTATTDAQGRATLNTDFNDAENALIIVKKAGYSNLVAKCPCKGMTYAISPTMKNLDGLRIVLNWGPEPNDLDSHTAFPKGHIYFQKRTGRAGTDANLDVDDMDGFGPETITIEKKHPGEAYVYAVHDFSNKDRPQATELSRSNAKVLVYIGQSLVRTYYVPKSAEGNLWTVFRITADGEFQDINALKGTRVDPANVLDSVNTYLDASTQVAARSVSATESGDARGLNKSGEAAYHAGNLDQAIDFYRQAIDIDASYGQAYSNLGLAYQKAGRTAEAIWANRKAIALASGPTAATVRASSFYNIGKIYEGAGQFSDALTQYQSAKREKANPVYDKSIDRVKAQVN